MPTDTDSDAGTPALRTTLERLCDDLVTEWQADAQKRRQLTPRDPVADALDWCAGAVREAVARAASDDAELSVSEYAALHHRPPSTVRRWCKLGLVRARRSGRDWVIPRQEPAPTFGAQDGDDRRTA